jgi:hypothetical protein
MILPIKQMIIQEGLLDTIRENRGKLSLLGGAAAGAGVYHNYTNSGAKNFGEYAGNKLSALGDSAKNGFNSAKNVVTDTYKNVTNPAQKPATPANSDKLKDDAIMKQGTGKQTVESALDPNKAKAFDADINNTFNEV